MTKLWGGRFADGPAPEVLAFTESASFDHVLVREDCAVLGAHAAALARAGLLEPAQADQAREALEVIAEQIASGRVLPVPGDEDIHTTVERVLLDRLPDVGGRLRAGLSRNDRVAAALRLWTMARGRELSAALADLIEVLIARAEEHREAILPGYTHLQRAQPVRLAHHLLAHGFALARDGERVRDAIARADASPLGAGALAGSTLGLDANATATDAGFHAVLANSLDAVAARDFVAEMLAAAAIAGVDLSRLGDEIVLWTSEEFGFAELADPYATGSSLMPQKKNPDVAELARGKAGRLIGNLTGLLATLKGLPLAYNRDLQEDKEPLFDSMRTLGLMLPALTGAIRTLRFDTAAMAAATEGGMLLATDLAEHLVRKGVAFRDAHEVVGKVVRRALERGIPLADVPLEELRGFSDAFGPEVREVLSARASVDQRGAPGPDPGSIDAQIEMLHEQLTALRD